MANVVLYLMKQPVQTQSSLRRTILDTLATWEKIAKAERSSWWSIVDKSMSDGSVWGSYANKAYKP